MSYVLKKPKESLFVHMDKYVPPKKQRKFLSLISKRQKGWPVAYLTGQKEFFGLNFSVNKNVLIPRPETEGLIELILEKIKDIKDNEPLSILDIGTGSGCIVIALAKTLLANSHELDHQYFGSDISKTSLLVAKKNARQHAIKIMFKPGSLLEPWKNQNFDVIVANLPYGWKEWKNNTSAETIGLKFEPQQALFTENQGLALYEKLFKQIRSYSQIRPFVNSIFFEFDPRQTKQIKKLASKILPEYNIEIKKDLAGKNRFACLSLQNFL